jgi:hypothetical protein
LECNTQARGAVVLCAAAALREAELGEVYILLHDALAQGCDCLLILFLHDALLLAVSGQVGHCLVLHPNDCMQNRVRHSKLQLSSVELPA